MGTDMTLALTYHMPADYEAPLIVKSRFDELTKEVNLEWSAEAVELFILLGHDLLLIILKLDNGRAKLRIFRGLR